MKKRLITAGCVLFWLVVWQLGAMALDREIFLVTPINAAKRLIELIPHADFWKSIGFSAARILLGFLLGLVTGTLLAVAAGKSQIIKRLLSPLMTALKSIPVASFTILALIWLSSRNLSVLVSFLICMPIYYSNMLEGIESLDPKLTEMANVFHIPAAKRFAGVYLSQLLPYFRSASALAVGLCWKSGAAAEVIGIPSGSIGEKLYMAKIYLETADLFAWTFVIIVVSWACEKLFLAAVGAVVKRIERM